MGKPVNRITLNNGTKIQIPGLQTMYLNEAKGEWAFADTISLRLTRKSGNSYFFNFLHRRECSFIIFRYRFFPIFT